MLLVEAHPVGVADDQAGVRLPLPREALGPAAAPRAAAAPPPRPRVGTEDGLVALVVLRELVVAAARQVVEQPGVPEGLRHPKASSTAGSCRKSPRSRNLTLGFRDSSAMSAQRLESSCVISSMTRRSSWQLPFRMPRRTKRSAVCAPAPRFCTEQWVLETSLTTSPELRHDLARQVRLPGAGHARQEEALAVQAVQEGVLHAPPPRAVAGQVGRLDAGLPVLALQALALDETLHPLHVQILPCAVNVFCLRHFAGNVFVGHT